MQRKYILLGLVIMISGAVLTGALQDIFFSGDNIIALRTFLGYAIMGLGIFALKRSIGSNMNIQGIGVGIGLFLVGSLINGKLFELLSGNAAEYAKYFGGTAAIALGGWVSKHSLFGDDSG